jgi:hypothetical protein
MAKLSIITDPERLYASAWVELRAPEYPEFDDGSGVYVRLKIRPWTRTTQSIVEKKAKHGAGIAEGESIIPDGTGDRKSEKFTQSLADYLLDDWENVVDASGAALPCTFANKLWAFESVDLATIVINEAKRLAGKVVRDEAKN